MNNVLFEIENTRVPVLLIGLSERNLLEGNGKLIAVRVTNFTDYNDVLHVEKKLKKNRRA